MSSDFFLLRVVACISNQNFQNTSSTEIFLTESVLSLSQLAIYVDLSCVLRSVEQRLGVPPQRYTYVCDIWVDYY